ncbi:MAG: hypothetical protein H7834_10215 [Magnetococcus sp. YQC-9]
MTLARPSKEAFFAFFAKNAPRAAFVSVVPAFWKRRSHLARSLAKNYASQSRCGSSARSNNQDKLADCDGRAGGDWIDFKTILTYDNSIIVSQNQFIVIQKLLIITLTQA